MGFFMSINEQKRIKINAGLLVESNYDFKMNLPEDIIMLFTLFKKHNKKLYIVGGAVRDALLGKTPKDIDVVTDALPNEVENLLTAENIYNFPSGKNFGIISAVINDETYEIATFRSDNYTDSADGRRPDSITFASMEDDAKRRDFTINALYYDIEEKKVIDLVGGVEDLKKNKIRPVGSAMDRFTEDRLRVLRAIRFSNRFGTELEPDIVKAIQHYKDLPGVSNERIFEEFEKGLKQSIKPEKFILDLIKYGLMDRCFGPVNIDKNIIPGLRDLVLVLSHLLWNNPPSKIEKVIIEGLKTKHEYVKAIQFLQKIKQQFESFDKLVFDPIVDRNWFDVMVKLKNIVLENKILSKDQILKWGKFWNIDSMLLNKFIDHTSSVSAINFPDLKGEELGKAIKIGNAKEFYKKL